MCFRPNLKISWHSLYTADPPCRLLNILFGQVFCLYIMVCKGIQYSKVFQELLTWIYSDWWKISWRILMWTKYNFHCWELLSRSWSLEKSSPERSTNAFSNLNIWGRVKGGQQNWIQYLPSEEIIHAHRIQLQEQNWIQNWPLEISNKKLETSNKTVRIKLDTIHIYHLHDYKYLSKLQE